MSILTISDRNGVLVIDHRLIATQLDIKPKNLLANIDKYLIEPESEQAFGRVAFETQALQTKGGIQETRIAYLTQTQAEFLMTLSRNTPQVVECKRQLVAAFEKAKELLNQTNPDPLNQTNPDPYVRIQSAAGVVDKICEWLLAGGVNEAIAHQFKLQELPKLEPSAKELCENARRLIADANPLKGQLYTPTELGLLIAEQHNLSKPPLGQAVNSALALAGFQTRVQKLWVPTERGRQFSEIVTFSAQHNSKSGTQIKWYDSVTTLIARSFLSTGA